MKIVHCFHHKREEKEVEGNPGFLVANKRGSFFSLGSKANFTKYNGFVIYDKFFFKTIESLNLPNIAYEEIHNNFYNIQRISKEVKETFFLEDDCLIYEIDNYTGIAELFLDCRKLYDFHDMGRIYNIFCEDDCIIIEYIKHKTGDLSQTDYKFYLAIKGAEFDSVMQWLAKDYEYDMIRDKDYHPQFIYHALNFNIKENARIVFAGSTKKEKAIEKANNAFENLTLIKRSIETKITTSIYPEFHHYSKKTELAYLCAKNSINNLWTEQNNLKGIYAGLPWFHQFWARDEAISTGALIKERMYKQAREIIFKYLDNVREDGRVSNRVPFSGLASADGIGWVFKRAFQLLKAMEKEDKLDYDDVSYIKKKLKFSIERLLEEHTKDGLAYNGPRETWMDTEYYCDKREGFRIEIQALRLEMYHFMSYLCNLTGNLQMKRKYSELEHFTLKKVRDVFYHEYLYDGKDDPTKRPNIFLAYYIYPDLLTKKEWQKCFDKVIPDLWLDWGGFTTIEKSNSLFTSIYTGENNKSYHRGDSWFFVNNLAAISLIDVNKKRYKKYIEKILKASKEDILFKGIIGHSSELSSAREQKGQGSLVQAWSAATLLELIHALY